MSDLQARLTGVRGTLRFLGALVSTNLKASLALRGAFWARVFFMFVNNFIFLVMWWVFFERVDDVRGWKLADTAAVYGVAAGSFGLAVIFGNGVQYLARQIYEGDLDSVLSQPKSVLLSAITSHSEPAGWGDLFSAAVLFAVCGYVTPGLIPLCLVLCASGAILFLSTGVLISSTAFWLGNMQSISRQGFHFLVIFSVYPSTIFRGWLKVFLYSAIPAGFVTFLPVSLLREFSWLKFAAILGAAVVYAGIAVLVFTLGLRRYESGSRFGVRA